MCDLEELIDLRWKPESLVMETRSDQSMQKVRLFLLRLSEMTFVVWQYTLLFGGVD